MADLNNLMQELRNDFIGQTVGYLKKYIPFYKKLNIKSFQDLPLVDYNDIQNNPNEFINKKIPMAFICYSSGTTGQLKQFQRSKDSLELSAKFHNLFSIDEKSNNCSLILQGGGNSVPFHSTTSNDLFIFSSKKKHFYKIKEFITDGIDSMYHISEIRGGKTLKAFTYFLKEDVDYNFKLSTVKKLVFGGEHLTRRWRLLFESIWNAEIYEVFGLTEFVHGNSLRSKDGYYYFPATVYPEIISLDGNKFVTNGEGIGELVMSNLYPFEKRQPIIRYKTSDIVKYKFSKKGVLGIIPLGRKKDCIINNNNFIIGGNQLIDILDNHSFIKRKNISLYEDIDYKNLGDVIYNIDHIKKDVNIFTNQNMDFYTKEKDEYKHKINLEIKELCKDFDYNINLIYEE